ncbi:hypothetical protein [Membranihabitans marinus]|uniref:hypothetical protein n=1 Tax=Membranihabitans marinus TaxID=1227546 RepID=UPI001F23024F|nr:hypothetical protein [Membranihabitans marinus]
MKTISIIELFYHAEVLRESILRFKNETFQLQIFTTAKILKNTGLDTESLPNVKFYLHNGKTNFISYFSKYKNELDNSDIVVINTLAYNLKSFNSLNGSYKIILRLHNTNRWFQSVKENYRLIISPYMIWKDISYSLRLGLGLGDFFYRKKIIKKIDYFAFANDHLRQYALNKFNLEHHKTIVLPFSNINDTPKKEIKSNVSDQVTFIIIGKIDFRKRDYLTIYEAFKSINFNQHSIKNVRLIFAGSANSNYGKDIISKFKAIDQKHFEVIYFNHFLPQSELEQLIQSTHFFIAPINIDTRFRIYTEEYGTTKQSGVFGDILRFQKPTLLPSKVEKEAIWKEVTYCYKDTNDLQHLIIDILNQKLKPHNFHRLRDTFSRSAINEQTMESIEHILKN